MDVKSFITLNPGPFYNTAVLKANLCVNISHFHPSLTFAWEAKVLIHG
jgi:hypothetical protein